MVTIGFIVEGDSEAILIKSESFQNYLRSLHLICNTDLVINAKSKSYLYHPFGYFSKLETRVYGWLQTLEDKGAALIFILLDRDNNDTSYTEFKSKVCKKDTAIVIVAKQAIEAWYLADTKALATYLASNIKMVEEPEAFLNPLAEIDTMIKALQNRGVTDKKALTKNMLLSGFSLDASALHPNCLSANYFKKKLVVAAQGKK